MCAVAEKTYEVPDVSCGHCAGNVTSVVREVAGVEQVEVDLVGHRVTVRGARIDDRAIRAAIAAAGYEAAP